MTWVRDHLQALLLQLDAHDLEDALFIKKTAQRVRRGDFLPPEDCERLRRIRVITDASGPEPDENSTDASSG